LESDNIHKSSLGEEIITKYTQSHGGKATDRNRHFDQDIVHLLAAIVDAPSSSVGRSVTSSHEWNLDYPMSNNQATRQLKLARKSKVRQKAENSRRIAEQIQYEFEEEERRVEEERVKQVIAMNEAERKRARVAELALQCANQSALQSNQNLQFRGLQAIAVASLNTCFAITKIQSMFRMHKVLQQKDLFNKAAEMRKIEVIKMQRQTREEKEPTTKETDLDVRAETRECLEQTEKEENKSPEQSSQNERAEDSGGDGDGYEESEKEEGEVKGDEHNYNPSSVGLDDIVDQAADISLN
jgi:hypothetical protein